MRLSDKSAALGKWRVERFVEGERAMPMREAAATIWSRHRITPLLAAPRKDDPVSSFTIVAQTTAWNRSWNVCED